MTRLKFLGVLTLGAALGALLTGISREPVRAAPPLTPQRLALAGKALQSQVSVVPALSSAQLSTLKTDLAANADTKDLPKTPDGAFAAAELYAKDASPDFWVWKTTLTRAEAVASTSVDGTTFNWTGAGYITRSQGERDAFRELFNHTGTVNPSLPNVRQAFADIFSGGTSPAPANRAHLLTVARRKANRGEKLYATGTGSTASPGTMAVEGTITFEDVQAAWNTP